MPGPSNRFLNLRSWRAVRRNRESCLHKGMSQCGMSQWVQWSWILSLKSRAREIRITTIYDLICPVGWAVGTQGTRVFAFPYPYLSFPLGGFHVSRAMTGWKAPSRKTAFTHRTLVTSSVWGCPPHQPTLWSAHTNWVSCNSFLSLTTLS